MNKFIISLLVSSALIAGCASNKVTEDKYSGFLNDYSNLRPDPKDEETLGYTAPGINWQQYHSVMVDKVVVITPDGEEKTDGTLLLAITDKYRALIQEKISKKFNLVDKAGPGTIRIQPAITSVYADYDDRAVYQYLPIGVVVTGAARTSGLSKQSARIMTEIRVVDSVNGQLLAQAVDLKEGKEKQDKDSEIVLADVIPILEQWAQRVTDVINGLKTRGN